MYLHSVTVDLMVILKPPFNVLLKLRVYLLFLRTLIVPFIFLLLTPFLTEGVISVSVTLV